MYRESRARHLVLVVCVTGALAQPGSSRSTTLLHRTFLGAALEASGSAAQDQPVSSKRNAVIAGRVQDENGIPLRSVRVEALQYEYRNGPRLSAAGQAQTDDRGEYRIFNLAPDSYVVRASLAARPGQPPAAQMYFPGVLESSDAVPVRASAGGEGGANFTMTKYPTFSARFTVTGAFPASPPPTVIVTALRSGAIPDTGNWPAERLGNGWYSISRLLPGQYEIFLHVSSPANQSVFTGHATVVVGNEDVDAGAIAVLPQVPVYGYFSATETLPAGIDPKKLAVNLRPGRGLPGHFAASTAGPGGGIGEDGRFGIARVPRGSFWIEVTGLPQDVYLSAARFGGRDALEAGFGFDGDSGTALELVLARGAGTVDGIVRDAQNEPVRGALVVLVPSAQQRDNPGAFKSTRTGRDGGFSISRIVPGDYTAFAWERLAPGAYQNPELLKQFEPLGMRVGVERAEHKSVELRLIPAGY
jgi:hypothetical protein